LGTIEDIAPLIAGEDPTCIECFRQMMFRQHFWHGHRIERAVAARSEAVGRKRSGDRPRPPTPAWAGGWVSTATLVFWQKKIPLPVIG
jgi:hypothetical protein